MFRRVMTAVAVTSLFAGAALAQDDYPNKPVTLVVGFSAGGGMDTLGRLVADRVTKELGQQMVVENRPGAGGTIAPGYVANASPDGYTLYLGETAATVADVVIGEVGYDPIKSFTPIAQLAVAPLALVANNDVPASNMSEFVELVKSKPGEFFYASSGVGTLQHLAGEQLNHDAGLEMEAVHFQGGSPSITALMSGEVEFAITSLNAASSQAEGGNLKVLGVTTKDPVPGFESIDTVSSVVDGFDAAPRQFVMAPAGTPAPVIEKLEAAFAAALADEALRADLSSRGLVPTYLSGAELAEQLPGVIETWSSTARKALDK
ncbi:Bug family tripartite tricarboxylate transporter substrate binding protein [Albibacillus kandeliae]|uniref:Bug family tripartite tricarboxylate transporter substrate binding protein n=1 Tax=Albibacillus kandeliae TaxID=2174228 RepID=UPI000D68E09A|nr:tripartite tricarboxylate transporter substrate binding protein [Albibacillus kandeliae]